MGEIQRQLDLIMDYDADCELTRIQILSFMWAPMNRQVILIECDFYNIFPIRHQTHNLFCFFLFLSLYLWSFPTNDNGQPRS